MGPSESESPRRQPATSLERTGRCRRISSAPLSLSAPLVLHWVTSLKAAKEPTGALCAQERITPTSTGPAAHTASVRATSRLIAPTLFSAPCVVVDTVPMMLHASGGGGMPHPRMPGRLLWCQGALTLALGDSPPRRLEPSPLVLPWLPHAREGGRPPSRVSFTFSTSIGETDSEVASHTGLTDKSVPMDMSEAGDQ